MGLDVYGAPTTHLVYFQTRTRSETNFEFVNFKMLNFDFGVLANNNIISSLILTN